MLAALTTVSAGAYLAERRAVDGWSNLDDPFRGEPSVLVGSERWIESTNGARIRVVECGVGAVSEESGDPGAPSNRSTIILAHGFASSADHWAPLAARLVDRGLRVVAFDQRGHGASSSGDGRFRAVDLGDDLAAVITAVGPVVSPATTSEDAGHSGPVVVGHSMGGIGIQAMLAKHPEVARDLGGLVLVATLARPVTTALGQLMSRLGGTVFARKVLGHRVHGRLLVRGGLGEVPYPTVLDAVRGGWVHCPDATRAGVMRDLSGYDFTETLERVEIPTTVVCGDLDNVTPLRENRRIADAIAAAELEVIVGSGHALTWEAVDRLAEIIVGHATTTNSGGQE